MKRLAQRVATLPKESFWQNLDYLVKGYEPQEKLVNLGKGFPDWKAPSFITEAASNAMIEKDLNQYTMFYGFPPLVDQLSQVYSKELQYTIKGENVLVSAGALGSLFCAFQAFLDVDDEVIVMEPFFDLYKRQVEFAGGKLVGVPLIYKPDDSSTASASNFKLDLDELQRRVTEKTKILVFNSPHNPTGKVFTREEIEGICDFVKTNDLILISDEVYERMILSDVPHTRPATFPDMFERTITIGSAGKSFSVTGWKIGWSLGPSELIAAMRVVHLVMVASIHTPSQYAIAEGFKEATSSNYFTELSDTLIEKRDLLCASLRDIGLEPIVPDGSYMMVVDFSRLQLPKTSKFFSEEETLDWKLCRYLIGEHGISTIPLSPFYSPNNKHLAGGMLRLCFCKENISAAVDAIRSLKPFLSSK